LYANYSVLYTSKKTDIHPIINIFFDPEIDQKNVTYINTIYQTVELAKQLSDFDPSTDGTPLALSKTFEKLLIQEKIKVSILDKQQIKQEKLDLFLSVNQGSRREPYMVVAKYINNPQDKQTTLLIGKGITFDSGGVHLKKEMNDMRLDKSGGCDVLCVLIALAKLKVKVNVIAVVGFTDNIIGENALLPSSIIKSRDNITVQIDSTDAEGRLVLADMISYGIEKFHPYEIIEISTLTGAVGISLGKFMTGC
jgi:leucyl aminopeptidase